MSASANSSLATAPAALDEQQKSDQIALHVYTKLFHLVHQARASLDAPLVTLGVGVGGSGSVGAGSMGARSVGAGSVAGSLERERERDKEREREKERERTGKTKFDRWFNLETPDSDLFPRELRDIYKAISTTTGGGPPPLYIHVLLSVPEAMNNRVLVALPQSNTGSGTRRTTTTNTIMGPNKGMNVNPNMIIGMNMATISSPSRIRIEPTPRYVLLERFVLTFIPRPRDVPPPIDIALPTIYKHGIPLFRSLFSLLRILPTWKLHKKLRRRTPEPSSQLSIQMCVSDRELGSEQGATGTEGSVLVFDVPPSPTHPPLPTLTHTFPSIPHPLGSFTLSTTYLESPTFQLDDLESLLSSRFISLDEGFVPTLAGTGGVGSKPRSDTTSSSQAESIAEKFVIPPTMPTPSVPSRIWTGMNAHQTMSGGSASSSPGHAQAQAHFSHLRQQLPSIAGHHHHSEGSVSGSGVSGSPPLNALPVLSRLRLESSPGPGRRSISSGSGVSAGMPSPGPPSPVAVVSPSSPVPISAPRLQPSYSQPSSFGREVTHVQVMSSGTGTGTQALPIRRPNTINPFKTNTLLGVGGTSGSGSGGSASGVGVPGTSAGSTHSIHSVYSLRHANSPLGPGGESLSRSPPHPSPLTYSQTHSPQLQPFPIQQSSHPQHSPQPCTYPVLSSGSGQGSESAFAGSGLGLGSGSGSDVGVQPHSPSPVPPPQKLGQGGGQLTVSVPLSTQQGQRKRYSSSFTHRYASSGSIGVSGSSPARSTSPGGTSSGHVSPLRTAVGGSGSGVGSSSSPGPEDIIFGKPRSRSSSFLGKRTEDDDISSFMQDIEMRKPLSGRWRMSVHERGSSGEGAECGTGAERPGRHGEESGGTDGGDSTDRTIKAGGGIAASETTMRGLKEGGPPHTTVATVNEMNNEEDEDSVSSSRRPSYTYQSHPYHPSPLSPRPRPSKYPSQTQPHSPVSAYTQLTSEQARHTPQGLPSKPIGVIVTGVGTMTLTGSDSCPGTGTDPSTSPPGAIPTTQAEVEVRLKKMNETFLKSLAGLGDGWTTSRSSGSHGRSLSEGWKSDNSKTGSGRGIGVPQTERYESCGRGGARGPDNLSQQDPEEVIGALELGGGSGKREESQERGRQVGQEMGGLRKPPSLMRYGGM